MTRRDPGRWALLLIGGILLLVFIALAPHAMGLQPDLGVWRWLPSNRMLRIEGVRLSHQGQEILRIPALTLSKPSAPLNFELALESPHLILAYRGGRFFLGPFQLGGSSHSVLRPSWLSRISASDGTVEIRTDGDKPEVKSSFDLETRLKHGLPVAGTVRLRHDGAIKATALIEPDQPSGQQISLTLNEFKPAEHAPFLEVLGINPGRFHRLSGHLVARIPKGIKGSPGDSFESIRVDSFKAEDPEGEVILAVAEGSILSLHHDVEKRRVLLDQLQLWQGQHAVTSVESLKIHTATIDTQDLSFRLEKLDIGGLRHHTLTADRVILPDIEHRNPAAELHLPSADLESVKGRLFRAPQLHLEDLLLQYEKGHVRMAQAAALAVDGIYLSLELAGARDIDYDYRGNQLKMTEITARRAHAESFRGHQIEIRGLDWKPDQDLLQLSSTQLQQVRLQKIAVRQFEAEGLSLDLGRHQLSLKGGRLKRLFAPALLGAEHRIPTRLGSAEWTDLTADWPKRRWGIRTLTLEEPRLRLEDDPSTRALLATQGIGADKTPIAAKDWRYTLGQLRIHRGRLMLRLKHHPGARWMFKSIELTADDLDPKAQDDIDLALEARLDHRGQLKLAGRLHQDTLGGILDLDLKGIRLRPLRSLLPIASRVDLRRGRLDLTGTLTVDNRFGGHLDFMGDAMVHRLEASRWGDTRPFLGCAELSIDDLHLSSKPRALTIHIIDVIRGYAHLDMDENHRLNLTDLFVRPPTSAPSETPPILATGLIKFSESRLDYTDRAFDPDLIATVGQLEGTIRGLSNRPQGLAQLSLEGRINQETPVRIYGMLKPTDHRSKTDLTLQFDGLDLTSFDQFAGQFAGYRIERGKMSLGLHYRLEDGFLNVEDKLLLNRLTLGERLSPDWHPFNDLALWLLKDARGNVDLDLPVTGDIENPDFALGALYLSALEHLPYRLLNSPASLLSSLIPVEVVEADVAFEAGQSNPLDPRTQGLLAVVAAARKNPGSTLEIEPLADPEQDRFPLAAEREKARRSRTNVSRGAQVLEAVDDDDLRALALARAAALRKSLIEVHGLPENQIYFRTEQLRPAGTPLRLTVRLVGD